MERYSRLVAMVLAALLCSTALAQEGHRDSDVQPVDPETGRDSLDLSSLGFTADFPERFRGWYQAIDMPGKVNTPWIRGVWRGLLYYDGLYEAETFSMELQFDGPGRSHISVMRHDLDSLQSREWYSDPNDWLTVFADDVMERWPGKLSRSDEKIDGQLATKVTQINSGQYSTHTNEFYWCWHPDGDYAYKIKTEWPDKHPRWAKEDLDQFVQSIRFVRRGPEPPRSGEPSPNGGAGGPPPPTTSPDSDSDPGRGNHRSSGGSATEDSRSDPARTGAEGTSSADDADRAGNTRGGDRSPPPDSRPPKPLQERLEDAMPRLERSIQSLDRAYTALGTTLSQQQREHLDEWTMASRDLPRVEYSPDNSILDTRLTTDGVPRITSLDTSRAPTLPATSWVPIQSIVDSKHSTRESGRTKALDAIESTADKVATTPEERRIALRQLTQDLMDRTVNKYSILDEGIDPSLVTEIGASTVVVTEARKDSVAPNPAEGGTLQRVRSKISGAIDSAKRLAASAQARATESIRSFGRAVESLPATRDITRLIATGGKFDDLPCEKRALLDFHLDAAESIGWSDPTVPIDSIERSFDYANKCIVDPSTQGIRPGEYRRSK